MLMRINIVGVINVKKAEGKNLVFFLLQVLVAEPWGFQSSPALFIGQNFLVTNNM